MVRRIVTVVISAVSAYLVFKYSYEEFYSYLPEYEKLKTINDQQNISSVLRENSTGLRDLYNHAFEKSIAYSFTAFLTMLFISEYIFINKTVKNVYRMIDNQRLLHKYKDKIRSVPKSTIDEDKEKLVKDKLGL